MDASTMLTRLAAVLDAHAWDELPALLHEEFECRLVHTGETFDRGSWVRFNAEYPGFDHFILLDQVANELRGAGRAHVTGYVQGQLEHFEVASFITVRDGLIVEMVEVWTDVGKQAPPGTRSS